MLDPIQFVAYIPTGVKSAMLVGSEGAQLKLEIPESDIVAAAKLIMFRGKALKVTIEEYVDPAMSTATHDEEATGDDVVSVIKRTRAARRRAGSRRV